MPHMQLFTALIVISSVLVSASSAAPVSHEFTELTGAPYPLSPFPASQTFSLGITFRSIDSITFSISGVAPPVDWRICSMGGGCGTVIDTTNGWSVEVYTPGWASAVGSFSADGSVSIADLPLAYDQLGYFAHGSFSDLKFFLHPVTDSLVLEWQYLQPASSVTWSDMKVTFNGQIAGWATGDLNYDGVVDAADYTVWRDTLGSPVDLYPDGTTNHIIDPFDYLTWRLHFGENVSSAAAAASIPEPATLSLTLIVCFISLLYHRKTP